MSGLNHPVGAEPPLFSVSDFSVTLYTASSTVRAVDQVTYSIGAGEILAIVGESGSGKTVLNLAPLGLLPTGVSADLQGTVRFKGVDLLKAPKADLERIRGGEIAVIFQDPLSALNPVRRIGKQISEVIERHLAFTAAAAESRTIELLTLVGIPDPASRMQQYPHELSGGMRQRVCIAMSIAAEPKLLIADEPTTALDVTVQAQIVDLLKSLQARLGMSVVLITHDIGVVSGMANKIAVMYAGRVVEFGDVEDVLLASRHPYTRGLLASVPSLTAPVGTAFVGLRGTPPDTSKPIRGCSFAPRCDYVLPACTTFTPWLLPVDERQPSHLAACPVVAPPVSSMQVAV